MKTQIFESSGGYCPKTHPEFNIDHKYPLKNICIDGSIERLHFQEAEIPVFDKTQTVLKCL